MADFNIHWWLGYGSVLEANLKEVIDMKNYPAYYPRLLNQTNYIFNWLVGMRKFTTDLYWKQHYNKTDSLSEIGEFDLLKHVKMQKQILEVYMPEKWTSPVMPVQNFLTCMPWTVTRNAFYPVFKRYVGKIFESGLYNKWDGFLDDINGVVNFHEIVKQLGKRGISKSDISYSIPENMWRNYLYYLKSYPNGDQPVQVAHSISFQVFWTLWLATILGLTFASITLFLECIYLKCFWFNFYMCN